MRNTSFPSADRRLRAERPVAVAPPQPFTFFQNCLLALVIGFFGTILLVKFAAWIFGRAAQ
jgi:hypothetical protein